jgi:hypothetical protein
MDFNGDYSYSDIIKISSQLNNEFNVYPNPATEYLHFDQISDQKVRILDSNGNVILDQIVTTRKFSIENLKPGLYFIQIVSNNKPMALSFIKI